MIKMLTASTTEVDDVHEAVEEIKAQLGAGTLQKNSVGLVFCYAEFVQSGVVAALSEALPFEIAGTTTIASAVPGEAGLTNLSLAVLTSDDVRFTAGMSATLAEKPDEAIRELYAGLSAKLSAPPSFMLAFLPLVQSIGGDGVINVLNETSGGVPVFGPVTVDHTDGYQLAYTLCGSQYSTETLSLVLMEGDVSPTFYMANISDSKVRKQTAIITGSNNNLLMSVNDMSVLDYIASLGLQLENDIGGLNTIPFVVDYGDGSKPATRSIFGLTEEGYAVAGGDMPVGATLALGSIDYDDVLMTTEAMAAEIAQKPAEGVLLFSCIGRNLALDVDTMAEIEALKRGLGDRLPYLFSYAGGEVCPVMNEAGALRNRFHNVTLIACVF